MTLMMMTRTVIVLYKLHTRVSWLGCSPIIVIVLDDDDVVDDGDDNDDDNDNDDFDDDHDSYCSGQIACSGFLTGLLPYSWLAPL